MLRLMGRIVISQRLIGPEYMKKEENREKEKKSPKLKNWCALVLYLERQLY